jgi:hypothetical protein
MKWVLLIFSLLALAVNTVVAWHKDEKPKSKKALRIRCATLLTGVLGGVALVVSFWQGVQSSALLQAQLTGGENVCFPIVIIAPNGQGVISSVNRGRTPLYDVVLSLIPLEEAREDAAKRGDGLLRSERVFRWGTVPPFTVGMGEKFGISGLDDTATFLYTLAARNGAWTGEMVFHRRKGSWKLSLTMDGSFGMHARLTEEDNRLIAGTALSYTSPDKNGKPGVFIEEGETVATLKVPTE